MSTMTSVERRPKPPRHRAAPGAPGWAVRYRYDRLHVPGTAWFHDDTTARYWARVYRRYGAEVRILERTADAGDRWWLLHADGTRLVPLRDARLT
jgi:hypothetical protein